MPRLNRFTKALWDLDTFYVFGDFGPKQSDLDWVDTITDTGTVLMGDAKGGVAVLTPSDGTVADNDEAYLASANALFLFADGCPLYAKARVKFSEVTATVANVAFGLQNAVGANSILDDGAGLKVSGSTLGVYKVDGSAVWKCVSACNGVATVSTSTKAAVAGNWYTLEIQAIDYDGVTMTVSFHVDGEVLRDSAGLPIRHSVAVANAALMQAFAGVKLGANTNNDTLSVDYIYAAQLRG